MTPEEAEEFEQAAAELRKTAAMLGEFWDALRAARLPDDLSVAVVSAWYQAFLDDEVVVTWESGDDD